MERNGKTNIVLIGMAGAGKSSVGAALARLLDLAFVDVDRLIEKDQQKPLQELLETLGVHGFREVEEKVLLSMGYENHVIATGGSAIYSEVGIKHLKTSSLLVLLDVSLQVLKQRVGDCSRRGLVKTSQQTFEQLLAERTPLYREYADVTLECSEHSVPEICQSINGWLNRGAISFPSIIST